MRTDFAARCFAYRSDATEKWKNGHSTFHKIILVSTNVLCIRNGSAYDVNDVTRVQRASGQPANAAAAASRRADVMA